MSAAATDVDLDSLIQSLPACKRCRDCRRGCDTQLPACRQCQKAGAECIFFDHGLNEYLPRSYIDSLVNHMRTITAHPQLSPQADLTLLPTVSASAKPSCSSSSVPSVTSELQGFEHHFAITRGSYRYFGGKSCLASSPLAHPKADTQVQPQSETRPLFGNLSATPEIHHFLVQTFFNVVHPLYPILDPSARYLTPDPPSELDTSERFILNMIYSISCHILSGTRSHFAAFGESSFQHAMMHLEASTVEPTITTLRAVLLLAINSMFDCRNGNIGQQTALATRLVIDLEIQDLNTEDSVTLQNVHSTIFSIENELATTLDRPATFPEPPGEIMFDTNSPSQYLCSLYRIQNRYRKGDTAIVKLLPPLDRGLDEMSPSLLLALRQTHLLVHPTPSSAMSLLDSISDPDSVFIFLTPHWVYRAATIVLQYRSTLDSAAVLEAYGNASSMLARAGRKWPSAFSLADSLKDFLKQSST